MQINGNIVVLPVPAEKQDLAYLPDRFETGERVQTPRGSFQVTAMSREQMEAAGYGVHHISDDGKYLIMGNGTRAFAVAAEQPEKDNPLRTAEMTLEDDYGMIDGVINLSLIHICGDPIQYADINTSYWQSHFYAFGRPPYN